MVKKKKKKYTHFNLDTFVKTNSEFCVGECWRNLSKENQLVHAGSLKYIINSRFQELSKEARDTKSTGEHAENVGKKRYWKQSLKLMKMKVQEQALV